MNPRVFAVVVLPPPAIAPPSGGIYSSTSLGEWSASQSSLAVAQIKGPDCALSGTIQKEDGSATSDHNITKQVTSTILAQAYTFSVYAKRAIGNRNIQLLLASSTFGSFVNVAVDLLTGEVLAGPFANGSYVSQSATITRNGKWWKVALTATLIVDTSVFLLIYPWNGGSGGTSNYTGDNVSSIAVWGADFR